MNFSISILTLLFFLSCEEIVQQDLTSNRNVSGKSKVNFEPPSIHPVDNKELITAMLMEGDQKFLAPSNGNIGQLGIGIILPPTPKFFSKKDQLSLANIQNDSFNGPLIPPHNFSNDGRVSFAPEVSWNAEFYLNVPEKIQGMSLLDAPAGTSMLGNNGLPFGVDGVVPCIKPGMKVTLNNGQTITTDYSCTSPDDVAVFPQGNPKTVYFRKNLIYPRPNNSNTSIWFQEWSDQGFHPSGHYGVCDPGQPESGNPNPYACEHNGAPADCYALDVIIPTARKDLPGDLAGVFSEFQLRSIRFQVKVANPKTANAQIVQSLRIPYPEGDEMRLSQIIEAEIDGDIVLNDMRHMFEPIFTADGRLFISRISNSKLKWQRNDGSSAIYNVTPGEAAYEYDMVYASIPEDEEACDIRKLSSPKQDYMPYRPITYAPKDPNINDRYGFAAKPFKDTAGNLLEDDKDAIITYPWVDKLGKNIFFMAIGPVPLHFEETESDNQTHVAGRTMYKARCIDGSPLTRAGKVIGPYNEKCRFLFKTVEDIIPEAPISNKNGLSVMGSWTNGKMILLDGKFNNVDFGLLQPDAFQREVALYQDKKQETYVRVGSTVDGDVRLPSGGFNINLIQSVENLFNYRFSARPKAPRDIIWTMISGKGMDEVIFDDYVDPNVLIYSDMNPSVEFEERWDGRAHKRTLHNGLTYSGWYRNYRNDGIVKLQNSATGFGDFLPSPPQYGVVSGNARAEPVALGGYKGKGFWMGGKTKITYTIPEQQNLSSGDWSYMLFLDSRMGGKQNGKILTFVDGSSVEMIGKSTVVFNTATGAALKTLTLPLELQTPWIHLAFSVENLQDLPIIEKNGLPTKDPASRVVIYVNGYKLDSFSVPYNHKNAFIMKSGDLRLGANSNSFRGWIDEFKVISRKLNSEEYCNHAFGSLVGVLANSPLWSRAQAYPASIHDNLTKELKALGAPSSSIRPKYACDTNLETSDIAHVEQVAKYSNSIREYFQHSHGKIIWDEPRPNAIANNFCLSCHAKSGANGPTFGTEALISARKPAYLDNRRQPLQPHPRVWGVVPAGFPGAGQEIGDIGFLLDRYIYPNPNPLDTDK